MNKLIVCGLIFLLSFNSYPQSSEKFDNGPGSKNYKIIVDKYLNDNNVSQLAKDLYLDKIKPTDSEENLSLLDSINSKGPARGFYFLVITKTMKSADGAYSELLGMKAKFFVEENTAEFLSYFLYNKDLLADNDLIKWATSVYGEIKIDSEGSESKAVNDLKTRMISNCNGLPEEYQSGINNFIGYMK